MEYWSQGGTKIFRLGPSFHGKFNELEYIEAITFTIGRGDLETGSMSLQTSNTMGDFFNLSTNNEDENCENCMDVKLAARKMSTT